MGEYRKSNGWCYISQYNFLEAGSGPICYKLQERDP